MARSRRGRADGLRRRYVAEIGERDRLGQPVESLVGLVGEIAQQGERQAFVTPHLLVAGELLYGGGEVVVERRRQRRHAHARDAREIVEMTLDGAQLEGERAWIAVVEDDEVEHRR